MNLTIKEVLIGFCLGTANIIPGVSGGTFLLVFKIYQRVFAILNNIKGNTVSAALFHIFKVFKNLGSKNSFNEFEAFLKANDYIFLFKLLFGAAIAILFLSNLMKYLIINHYANTYALFFGLIAVSIIIPFKMLKSKRIYLFFFACAGAILTIYIVCSVNPYTKAYNKSLFYKNQYIVENKKISLNPLKTEIDNTNISHIFFSFDNKYSLTDYIYTSICGAISVSAMVLPGISGSLVLILMGEYFEVISAIAGLKTFSFDCILFLSCFAFGMIFGVLLFAKIISYVLNRFYNQTMAFLIGLMAGSLYALWPFKKYMILPIQYVKTHETIDIVENVKIYTNINILPQTISQIFYAATFCCIGCLIMYFFVKQEDLSKK